MIGIIDSGLGGYTIYHALRHAYPEAAFLFLADQKNAPYGSKTAQVIQSLARRNVQWLVDQGIKQVVIACNTINAVALNDLKQVFPQITFYDVVTPTLNEVARYPHSNWTIVGTPRTIESQIYQENLKKHYPQAQFHAQALPDLVKLIEDLADEATIESYVRDTLKFDHSQDGVILACTHYPLAQKAFHRIFNGPQVNSIEAMVKRLETEPLPKGPARCVTTGKPEQTRAQIKALFNETVDIQGIVL